MRIETLCPETLIKEILRSHDRSLLIGKSPKRILKEKMPYKRQICKVARIKLSKNVRPRGQNIQLKKPLQKGHVDFRLSLLIVNK